jgi:hypothetical protein
MASLATRHGKPKDAAQWAGLAEKMQWNAQQLKQIESLSQREPSRVPLRLIMLSAIRRWACCQLRAPSTRLLCDFNPIMPAPAPVWRHWIVSQHNTPTTHKSSRHFHAHEKSLLSKSSPP